MKIVFWLLGSFFWSVYLQAAVVSLGTPPSDNAASYVYEDKEYDVFANITEGEAFGSNPGGEELIWLGAHESWPGGNGAINVNLDKADGIDATGKVSLVLSAAEPIEWIIDVASGVQLKNIFIIALGEEHRVRVNNVERGFALDQQSPLAGVNVLRSNSETACGYEFPSSNEGCSTENALGLEEILFGIFSDNVLAIMQADPAMPEDQPLQLTSFNGSYYVNQFDVEIDSVIPLPASALLFGSALVALVGFRRQVDSPPTTS